MNGHTTHAVFQRKQRTLRNANGIVTYVDLAALSLEGADAVAARRRVLGVVVDAERAVGAVETVRVVGAQTRVLRVTRVPHPPAGETRASAC